MAFCSFTKEGIKHSVTDVENVFLTEYMPEAEGDAVKVYLYGLYLCKNAVEDFSLADFSKQLFMDESTVKDCFKFWEEFDIVTIISNEPFMIKYLPIAKTSKPRKFKPEKYKDFNDALQLLLSERMITVNEYSEYFSLMEDLNIKPEAMLLIVKYCVDLKGSNIGRKYIATVVKDFYERGLTTIDSIEKELAEYTKKIDDVKHIAEIIGLKKNPDIEDYNHFKKWRNDFQFEIDAIIACAKRSKSKTFSALDNVMLELYSAKMFSVKEIESYFEHKESVITLARNIASQLSIHVAVIQPVIDSYVNPWLSLGFDEDTLTYLAHYCFEKERRSLNAMNETVNSLYEKGLISLSDIVGYVKRIAKEDEFIKLLFDYTEINRQPNKWDRSKVAVWRNWGFSDEMISEAAKRSSGKTSPLIYMNAILGSWKSRDIFSIDLIPKKEKTTSSLQNPKKHFENERVYSKEELDALITDIDSIEL